MSRTEVEKPVSMQFSIRFLDRLESYSNQTAVTLIEWPPLYTWPIPSNTIATTATPRTSLRISSDVPITNGQRTVMSIPFAGRKRKRARSSARKSGYRFSA